MYGSFGDVSTHPVPTTINLSKTHSTARLEAPELTISDMGTRNHALTVSAVAGFRASSPSMLRILTYRSCSYYTRVVHLLELHRIIAVTRNCVEASVTGPGKNHRLRPDHGLCQRFREYTLVLCSRLHHRP